MNEAERNSEKTPQRVCPWWLAFTFDNALRRLFHRPEVLLGSLVGEGQTVLDLGCGMGYFSIGMARLVGEKGTVISADLQEQMLERVRARSARAGLAGRVKTHLCEAHRIGLEIPVDFALAFWMVHEVPDQSALFKELHALLLPSASLFIVEPKLHVSGAAMRETERLAESAGFRVESRPRVSLSRAALLGRD